MFPPQELSQRLGTQGVSTTGTRVSIKFQGYYFTPKKVPAQGVILPKTTRTLAVGACNAERFWLIEYSQHFISASIFKNLQPETSLFIVLWHIAVELQRRAHDRQSHTLLLYSCMQKWAVKTAVSFSFRRLICLIWLVFRPRWKCRQQRAEGTF